VGKTQELKSTNPEGFIISKRKFNIIIEKNDGYFTLFYMLLFEDSEKKSILMPHACQKIGWWPLLLTVLVVVSKIILTNTFHDNHLASICLLH
jgi:hypothetical protein